MSKNSLEHRTLSSVSNHSKQSKSTPNRKSKKSRGGVNLTPLISALLLAGIKLSLEQNKKTKKGTDASKSAKSAKSKRRPKTV